jgi:hypothetical protein
LAHSDFPQINFWTRKGWLEYVAAKEDVTTLKENTRGKVRASQGINVAMGYVEKEDGEAVDGHVASDMRKCARSIWVHIATVSETGPPAKWGEAGIKFNEMYRKQMYERFPMLQLCESDWKVDQIATDNYPSWYSVWRKKHHAATIKEEQDSVPPDSNMFKRPHDSTMPPETDSKRRKVKNAKENTEELEQAPNANEIPNSSITGIDSRLGPNFSVWNSHYNYYSAYIINSNSSITHYLRYH